MKTTIKLTKTKAIEVSPIRFTGRVLLQTPGDLCDLSPDQANFLIFAIEQALAVIDQQHQQAIEAMRVAA